jgi:DNA-binding MarR family transcriptional regulator
MAKNAATHGVVDRMVSDCIAVRVRLINRVVTGLYDEALRPHGLRVSQANVLVAVARMGEARPADVCRLLKLEKSTLSRDVEVMKREGWLESDPPSGGRNQVLRLTRAGSTLLAAAHPAWEAAQAEAHRLIGGPGVEALKLIAQRLGFGKPGD